MTISVIIPTYNEEKSIGNCLTSLSKQTVPFELIVVDDGSTDKPLSVLSKFQISNIKYLRQRRIGLWPKIPNIKKNNVKILKQEHQGPGAARNLGAKNAQGETLVFVDADMTFAPDFLEKLTLPIEKGKTKGTFTKEEYVANWDNVWARCWNYNAGLPNKRRLSTDYPDTAPVFRAILASEFNKVSGFTPGTGWTDDWSLSRKLGYTSTVTTAVCYHANSETLQEVFQQAEWIGKNEFLTKNLRLGINLFRYSPIVSLLTGITKSVQYRTACFFIFKIIYDLGITSGLIKSSYGHKNK